MFPDPTSFNGEFCQMFNKEKNANPIQIFPGNKEKAILPDLFYEDNIILISAWQEHDEKGKL